MRLAYIMTIGLVWFIAALGIGSAYSGTTKASKSSSSTPVSCPSPGTPPYAFRKGRCCEEGSEVKYECHDGYKLVGKAKITCQKNGAWNFKAPVCEEKTNEYGLTYARFYGQETNSIDYYDEYGEQGPEQGPIVTDRPGQNTQGQHEWTRHATQSPTDRPKTSSVMTDRPNHNTQGQNYHTKQRDLTTTPWTRPTVLVTFSRDSPCGERPFVPMAKPEKHMHGNQTAYECKDGYVLLDQKFDTYLRSRAEIMICGDDGQWRGEKPFCQELTCSLKRNRRPRLIKRYPEKKQYKAGDTVHFKCKKPSYRLVGKSDITCSEVAAGWTEKEPTCESITCPRTKLENGVIFNPHTRYQTNQTYECFMGYTLKGPIERSCLRNGRWSGMAPVCQPLSRNIYRECPLVPTPDGGYQEMDGMKYGSSVTFMCGDSLYLRGSEKRTCSTDGYWSGTQPTCDGENSFDMPDDSAERITKLLDRLQLRRPETEEDVELRNALHKVDMVGTEMFFAMDASGSIDNETFDATKEVILAIIDKLDVSNGLPGGNKLGLLTFDHDERIHIRPKKKKVPTATLR